MDVKDRLDELLLPRRSDHHFRCRQPAIAILATDLGLVDAAGERAPQGLGQSRDREKDRERIAVHQDQPGVGIDRPDRAQSKDVIGTFQHPAPALPA